MGDNEFNHNLGRIYLNATKNFTDCNLMTIDKLLRHKLALKLKKDK